MPIIGEYHKYLWTPRIARITPECTAIKKPDAKSSPIESFINEVGVRSNWSIGEVLRSALCFVDHSDRRPHDTFVYQINR
ncbi:hypothetical protein CA13_65870 [Planctomycetes bacterium CA13]|uniref:Uncharacterized protein n=1 Tax=Novipirellula herctigrandis TaxID=2527986 RepID=A0A5C5ZD69_9BACT|nr:hypothetical protein CA13_65870 [Planctomycetes bacterium CA13]